MRFLLNENVSGAVIRELRQRGHDVRSVKETMRAAPDGQVLKRAQDENRVLVTHDKDFAELAFRARLGAECGIVLLRLSGRSPAVDNRRIVHALDGGREWNGRFAVVTDTQVRIRPLP
jgi:predicted nuclease of predicted toxin-antitoxin system